MFFSKISSFTYLTFRFKLSKVPCPRCGLWNEKWDAACNHIQCGQESGTPCENPRADQRYNQTITHYCAGCGRESIRNGHFDAYEYNGTDVNHEHQPHYCIDNDNQTLRKLRQKEGQLNKLLMEKASISINGVSLTISKFKNNFFEINVIPHTLKLTNLKRLKNKDVVNVELDIFSKYILNL